MPKKSEITSKLNQLKTIYTQKVSAATALRIDLTSQHERRHALNQKQRAIMNQVNSLKQKSVELNADRRKIAQNHDMLVEENHSLQCAIDEIREFRTSKQVELNAVMDCIQKANFFLMKEATLMHGEYNPVLETWFMMQEELRSIEYDMYAIQHKVHPDIEMLRARWQNLKATDTMHGNGASSMNDNHMNGNGASNMH